MIDFLVQNKEWVFSGIGVTVLVAIIAFGRKVLSAVQAGPVRVRVAGAIIDSGMGRFTDALAITVLNAGQQPVFLGNVFLELNTREKLVPLLDEVTGESQQQRRLEPGQQFTFHITANMLRRTGKSISEFRCAAVADAATRVYRSSGHQLRNMMTSVLAPRN